MDPALILKRNIEKEKHLRTLRENTKLNATEISNLLTQIRNDYEILIVEHTSYTCSGASKDIDESLWKQCFYRQIEEYRKSIRKTVQILDQPEESATTTAVNLAVKARTHLARLTSAFSKFLSDGSIFYQELMLKLESQFKVLRLNELGENFLHCIYRCLLYLGDLSRYRELYSNSRDKDYSEAERYYERAAFLVPTAGNPQNQLAVLASYTDTECVAVYHYCRSVMVLKPFAAGLDNLGLIFEKNIRLYAQSKIEEVNQDRSRYSSQKVMSNKIRSFLVHFIRLHGDLFLYTRKAIKSVNNTTSKSNGIDYLPDIENHSTDLKEFDVEAFSLLNQEVLDNFEYLLSVSAFSDTLLLKLLVISIFSVHHGASILSTFSSQIDNSTTVPPESGRESSGNVMKNISIGSNSMERSITESLALSFLFALVKKSASRVGAIAKSSDKANIVYAFRILPLLSVFAEWGGSNTKYFLPVNPSMARDEQIIVSEGVLLSVKAGSDLMLLEGRSKSGVRASLSSLHELIESNIRSANTGAKILSDYKGKPLREHTELRGFLPLSRRYEVFFYGIDPLTRHLPSVADETARDRRLRVLAALIHDWPISIPDVQNYPNLSSNMTISAEVPGHGRSVSVAATSSSNDSGSRSRERGGGRESSSKIESRSPAQLEKVRSDSLKIDVGEMLEKRAGLLMVAPGAILAAREKEKERERNIERSQHERSQGRRRDKRDRTLVDGVAPPRERRERGGRRIRENRERQRERERASEKLGHMADPDYNRNLVKRKESRGSGAIRQSQNEDPSRQNIEEFPPLPGAREPQLQASNVVYASSAIFDSKAPSANPFEDDEDDDDDDDEYSDGSSLSDSDDDYEVGVHDYNIGNAKGEIELGQQQVYAEGGKWDLGIGIDMTLKVPDSPVQSKMTAAGVFGGLFSGSNSNMGTLFGGYSSPLAELISDATGVGNGNMTQQNLSYDDDDFADDDVVFRPAFSRSNTIPSPSLPLPPIMPFSGEMSSTFSTYVGGPSIINGNNGINELAVVDERNGLNNYGLGTSMMSTLMSDNVTSTYQSEPVAVQEDNVSTTWQQPWNSSNASSNTYQKSPTQNPVGGSPMVYGHSSDAKPAYSSNNSEWNRKVEDNDHFVDWWGQNNPNNSEKLRSIQLPPPAVRGNSLPNNEGYSKNMRGPPAMQRITPGTIARSAGETPMPPPGLMAPPGLSGSGQTQQQGSGTWTANPFYKKIG